jgi:GT2 family glycosyltransferase
VAVFGTDLRLAPVNDDSFEGGDGFPQCTASIFVVVVLYQQTPEQSVTVQSLRASLAHLAAQGLQSALCIRVMLWDNTPGSPSSISLGDGWTMRRTGRNAGLAQAYNEAIELAAREQLSWILTLDQDTRLPENYFIRALEVLRSVDPLSEVGVVLPFLMGGPANRQTLLSPHFYRGKTFVKAMSRETAGIFPGVAYAFNSGALLRVTALQQVGGYDPRFWLDFSDTLMFHRLGQFGKRAYIVNDLVLEHSFAMKESGARVSEARYRNLLLAESAFYDQEMGFFAGMERAWRLLVRTVRLLASGQFRMSAVTASVLASRMLRTPRARLRHFDKLMSLRSGDAGSSDVRLPERHSKISVCMATYNGERFIEEQLASILSQLGAEDELIVIDDASHDRTRDVIRSFADDRIHLIPQAENCGVIATFERAIRSATGDILFLSDMDDVWMPGKVRQTMVAFMADPRCRVVATGLEFMNERGEAIEAQGAGLASFSSKLLPNLLRNRYQGSTMAFRAEIMRYVLPFPKRKHFLHDAWIGTRNTIRGGGTTYLRQPLLRYRRHGSNVSKRLSPGKQALGRLQFVWAHLKALVADVL